MPVMVQDCITQSVNCHSKMRQHAWMTQAVAHVQRSALMMPTAQCPPPHVEHWYLCLLTVIRQMPVSIEYLDQTCAFLLLYKNAGNNRTFVYLYVDHLKMNSSKNSIFLHF